MIKLAVFLGNPGKEYENTRHNAGFLFASFLYPSASWQMKFHSAWAKEDGMQLLKPMTYMNRSGAAVGECASYFHLKPEEVLVVHDDLELPLSYASMQKGGGLQGHNGLRDIKEKLGSAEFYRLRIGIGRPLHSDVRLYVTSPFSKEEKERLQNLFIKLKTTLSLPAESEFKIKL